ncbi:GNAT family N-acetyltransferase [Sporosarcina thermotolerans]|uniref:GNAT family N-acetyltransferase n=1 Tax=Sporosarcina thermotolerans TaxID=633404 RepID=A0AAW9AA12_9BACL|nr:GNAT family N-acetyltransferase [Sporosarcina thermotolerans]MDW0115968.1 GNAT family N-acetyltransferase [Sporosarcina thermotolerans]WHT46824.1 GNAT family N-acetyltransferase [Sporosarcina thermotolerans]
MEYFVERVNDLNVLDIGQLVQESEKEGYRFVTRLVSEFQDGTNTFSKPDEALFCVVNNEGKVVAIGGINQSPFAQDAEVARLRRFYVLDEVRRQGVGTLLQQTIVDHAKNHFKEITVRTDSAKADAFYRACGFEFDDSASETTHILRFDSKE